MIKIGIIIGSTRQNRVTPQVAHYILDFAKKLNIENASFELLDLNEYDLPIFNEPTVPAKLEEYSQQSIKDWAAKIKELDGYIFVTPEYNKSMPAVLKNAIDHLADEWANKAAGIVSFGSTNGVAATLSLRQVFSNRRIAAVTPFGAFNLFTDFEDQNKFTPSAVHEPTITSVIEETVSWSKAMKSIR